ncbi:MAG: hypothetical protein R8P61_22835 [Bacteroidia bacterium]|nr:hypothetical protein [Bacteroidia bacterium]
MQKTSREIAGLPIQKVVRYLLGISVVGLSLFISFLYLSRDIFFDDAFMFIRYAYNLAEHGVFGWNADEAAYGCTSTGYVFSNYLLIKTGLATFFSQENLLVLQSVIYFLLALLFIHKSNFLILDKGNPFRWEISLGILLLILLNPLMRRNLTGMDTMMSLMSNALLIYAAYLYDRKKDLKNILILAIAAYFTFFVRPDNGLYAALFPLLFMYGNKWKDLFLFCGFFAFLMIGDMLIKYVYFGAVLPIPFYVKNGAFYEAYLGIDLWNTWQYLADFMLYALPFFLASVFYFRANIFSKGWAFILPFILTQLYFLRTVPVMGFESRLLLPSLPFVVAFVGVGINGWMKEGGGWGKKDSTRVVLILLGLVFSIALLHRGGKAYFQQKKELALSQAEAFDLELPPRTDNDSLAWYAVELMNELVEEAGDKDFVFAASEHGFLSSQHSDKRILCLVGLHNSRSLNGKALNAEEMELSLKEYEPDLIWMPHYDYPALNYYLVKAAYFEQNYDWYPDLLDFGLAVKKDSPYREKLMEKLREFYPEYTFEAKLSP